MPVEARNGLIINKKLYKIEIIYLSNTEILTFIVTHRLSAKNSIIINRIYRKKCQDTVECLNYSPPPPLLFHNTE